MDLENQEEFQAQKQSVFSPLYDNLKPLIWVIKITGKDEEGQTMVDVRTGFIVRKDGLLLTAAHGGWRGWDKCRIQVRTLVETEFVKEATLLMSKDTIDVSLLKIKNANEFAMNELGNGELGVGQLIMCIGHPYECVGSCSIGRVMYPCTANPVFEFDEGASCGNYSADEAAAFSTHRIMGQVFNDEYGDEEVFGFLNDVQATIPIIHSNGLVGGVGGSAGAPIFNLEGQIVGMFLLKMDDYDIGLHVSVIKKFMDQYLNLFG